MQYPWMQFLLLSYLIIFGLQYRFGRQDSCENKLRTACVIAVAKARVLPTTIIIIIIKNFLTEFFKKEPRWTMCAILSPTFKIREFQVKNFPAIVMF